MSTFLFSAAVGTAQPAAVYPTICSFSPGPPCSPCTCPSPAEEEGERRLKSFLSSMLRWPHRRTVRLLKRHQAQKPVPSHLTMIKSRSTHQHQHVCITQGKKPNACLQSQGQILQTRQGLGNPNGTRGEGNKPGNISRKMRSKARSIFFSFIDTCLSELSLFRHLLRIFFFFFSVFQTHPKQLLPPSHPSHFHLLPPTPPS